MKVFVIGGKSGSGKGHVANLIKKYYDSKNEKTIITEFSKYLKLYAYEMLNYQGTQAKPRKFLQEMGEKIRNDINQEFLINRMKEDILVYQPFYENIVIADARRILEMEAMKSYYLRCYTIYISSNKENKLTPEEKNHITETELDGYNEYDFELEYVDDEQIKNDVYQMLEKIK